MLIIIMLFYSIFDASVVALYSFSDSHVFVLVFVNISNVFWIKVFNLEEWGFGLMLVSRPKEHGEPLVTCYG